MQQNRNQYHDIDRRKILFLVAAAFVILVAILIVVYLFTDRTNASTGYGDALYITPERIEQISDEVGDSVLDTLSTDVLADLVSNSVAQELTKEKIYKVISDKNVDVVAIGEDDLNAVVKKLFQDTGISGSSVFTEEQKKYIRLAVARAVQESMAGINVAQPFSVEEKNRLAQQLRQELSDMLRSQIQNSSYRLTDQELERIKQALHLESMVTGKVDSITRQQIEKLQTNVVNQVQKSVKTPVKGVDYLTTAEVKAIQDTVLKKANQEAIKQVGQLTAKISEIKSSVSTLTQQVKELKGLDHDKSADIAKIQQSITQINHSVQEIYTVTGKLSGDIAVSGSSLEKVTGSGSEVQASKMPVSNMTIAEFVDVLAGNDRVYTGAVQELDKIVKQLKDDNDKQDTEFDQSLKQLEGSLDENGKEMEDVKTKLEQSDQQLKDQMDQQSEEHKQQLSQQAKEQQENLDKQAKQQQENLDKQAKEQQENLDKQAKQQQENLDQQAKEQQEGLTAEQKAREDADSSLQSQIDDTNALIGDKEDASKAEGETIFQKIGSILRILSSEGIEGLRNVLNGIGGAETLEEGVGNIHTDLTDARARVSELEKEKWISGITLLAQAPQEGGSGLTYEESGSAYVYQIPLVTEEDQIDLSADDTAIVVEFKKPGRLPSNAAFTTSGNSLLITFTNRPTRNIEIVSIHVYKNK